MLIQFDREDSENLVITFDNTESDAEQMQDFIAWLESSGLEFSKLKMKIPGVAEKVTNLFVKKSPKVLSVQAPPVQQVKPVKPVVSAPVPPPAVVKAEPVQSTQALEEDEDSDSEVKEQVLNAGEESSSESESEEEPAPKTKKTTKRAVNSRK